MRTAPVAACLLTAMNGEEVEPDVRGDAEEDYMVKSAQKSPLPWRLRSETRLGKNEDKNYLYSNIHAAGKYSSSSSSSSSGGPTLSLWTLGAPAATAAATAAPRIAPPARPCHKTAKDSSSRSRKRATNLVVLQITLTSMMVALWPCMLSRLLSRRSVAKMASANAIGQSTKMPHTVSRGHY